MPTAVSSSFSAPSGFCVPVSYAKSGKNLSAGVVLLPDGPPFPGSRFTLWSNGIVASRLHSDGNVAIMFADEGDVNK